MSRIFLALLLMGGTMVSGQGSSLPILGPDAWFRPRDTVVYYLDNPKGESIDLTLAIGDLNTYLQGQRQAILWVIGPDGQTLSYERIADDGITSGNFRFKDGLGDVYADQRYRAWAEEAADLPLLAGKARSPLADNPKGLAVRHFSFPIAAAGKGVYRVVLLSCWDHWVSLETEPPLEAALAAGAGPLALRPGAPLSAWLFGPSNASGFGLTVLEEVKPYGWRAAIKDASGKTLANTEPQEAFNFAVVPNAPTNQPLEIDLQPGAHLASLHLNGIAPVFAPSAKSAERFKGGRLYSDGDAAFAFPQQVTLNQWLKSLSAEDLVIPPAPAGSDAAPTLDKLKPALDAQIGKDGKIRGLSTLSFRDIKKLLTSEPFREKSPEIARALALRVAVSCALEATTLNEYFSYQKKPASVLTPGENATIWNTAYRSNWLSFSEADLASFASGFAPHVEAVMPKNVVKAWHSIMDLWALARGNSSLGECSNQWCMILSGMSGVQQITGNPELLKIINERLAVMTDGIGLGRTNPLTPRASLASEAGYGFASDTGMTGAGYLAESYGYDGEYDFEQLLFVRRAWELTRSPDLLKWFNSDYQLRTHLSMPWKAGAEAGDFTGIVSPTDLNFRTTYFSHRSGLPSDAVSQVNYGTLWQPVKDSPSETWPGLDKESWTRSIDGRFHFLNRRSYYAVVYTGETVPDWTLFRKEESTTREAEGALVGSIRLAGYTGMHYKGFGRKSTKPGGVSVLYIKDFGTALLSQNIDVPYTNTVWGKRKTPISPIWEEGQVDPFVVAAAYDADPGYEADPQQGIFTKQERMRYAPVLSSRQIHLNEEAVQVELDVTALEDLDLPELYEALPLLVQSRSLIFVGEDGSRTTVDPSKIGPRELSKESWKITALELSDESVRGLRIAFSQPVEVRLAGAIQYRDEAPLGASVQVILNGAARRGDVQRVAYTLTSLKAPEVAVGE